MAKERLEQLKKRLTEGESQSDALDLIKTLAFTVETAASMSESSKVSKAVAYGTTLLTVGTALKHVYKFYKKNTTAQNYTIKISEMDASFELVEKWFMEALPEEKQLSVFAHTLINKGAYVPTRSRDDGSKSTAPKIGENDTVEINFSFDGTVVQQMTIAGHEVQVHTYTPENQGGSMGAGSKNRNNSRSINIICPNVQARNDVLDEIEKQAQYLAKSKPKIYVNTRWGEFSRRADVQPRAKSSVILKEGQMDRIISHINTFLENREAYTKADIPFRTGILLYGEPGSGKSSTAAAIANELGRDVYIVSLSSMDSDEYLNECFANIPRRSVVILEDIDVASSVKERDDSEKGVTMAGILNVLDGFQSAPETITIMTTNHLESLDPAVIRPGRVDLVEHLNALDDFQLRGLCEYFMGFIPEDLPHITPSDDITSAEIMGVIRKHLPDFENAESDLIKYIDNKLLTKTESLIK